jgi:lipopolysaccharide export system permease protein
LKKINTQLLNAAQRHRPIMKKLDRLMLQGFVGPFAVAFGIALFVLIMQFLWLYIDEIAGKGVSIFILFELIGYLSITMFPMALPIGVLIASVMVVGNMAERYELSSFKSAGVSLLRVMRPLMFVCAGVALFSYTCSDYIIPISNLKFKSRLFDIRKQKPALSIEKGVFNDDFRQFVIRVGDKEPDGETIRQVMIEDQSTAGKSKFNQILADSGQMYTTADKRFFVMNLFDGAQYQEPLNNSGQQQRQKFPFVRTNFRSWTKVWDMREFEMNRTDEDRFKTQRSMLSMEQLRVTVDSLHHTLRQAHQSMAEDLLLNVKRPLVRPQLAKPVTTNPLNLIDEKDPNAARVNDQGLIVDPLTGAVASATTVHIETATTRQNPAAQPANAPQNLPQVGRGISIRSKKDQPTAPELATSAPAPRPRPQAAAGRPALPAPPPLPTAFPRQVLTKPLADYGLLLETFEPEKQKNLANEAIRQVKIIQTNLESDRSEIYRVSLEAVKTSYELYIKYSFALVCFVFLFIGGPMGAIIRKGGFGYPILISIIFFVAFIFLTVLCRKLAESYVLTPLWAALMPCLLLMPLGMFLTRRASNDAQLFSTDGLERIVRRIGQRVTRSKA